MLKWVAIHLHHCEQYGLNDRVVDYLQDLLCDLLQTRIMDRIVQVEAYPLQPNYIGLEVGEFMVVVGDVYLPQDLVESN